jgi:hypothetical protein
MLHASRPEARAKVLPELARLVGALSPSKESLRE